MTTAHAPARTRLVVIGGVAGGATAAARARRVDEYADITVIERGPYVSYANCGLPYFISRDIENRESLLLETPEGFDARYGVRALVNTEAVEIDRVGRRVRIRDAGGESWLDYDRLILAQGGNPITPPFPGSDAPHVFTLWNVPDMDRLHKYIGERTPKTAVIVGGGFIGLEMAEAFTKRGIATTVVELLPTLMALMDPEFGRLIEREFERHGLAVITGAGVAAVHGDTRTVSLTDGQQVPAELVLLSVGVRPELTLAVQAGLTIGVSGGLLVDDHLRTSDENIFAAGDMVEVEHRVSGRRVRMPLAGPANRQGRIAASNALGVVLEYGGALGTSAVKILDATAAMTGLSERAAREAGFDVGIAIVHMGHHAGYYPGARPLTLKLVYDRADARLLGAQAFGYEGVEKRIDVLAMALHGRMTLHDLAKVDLAYAPPFSSANDPINVAAFVAENDWSGFSPLVTASQLARELASPTPPLVLDVRTATEFADGHLAGALHVPVDDLRDSLDRVPRDRRIVVHCKSGFRGHLATRILKQHGYADVANVTGGWVSMTLEGGFD